MIQYHMCAFLAGFLLDLMFGDPYWMPHPIRLIGNWISLLEKWLLVPILNRKQRENERELKRGKLLVAGVLVPSVLIPLGILWLAYFLHPLAGMLAESVMTYQLLATKCLKEESMKVYDRLRAGDLEGARKAVSMIVGRDTACLDETGVAKAAIETVAENASDGVIAPMLYLALAGPVAGFFYKATNTMDSMVGYKNDKYLYFGRAAAKLDDVLNYLPARLSALLLILSTACLGKEYSAKRAWEIFRRDRMKHASPNSAQTEAACAGALGIRLAGDASYFGKTVKKPFIGDDLRPVEYADIERANRLLYGMAFLGEACCLGVLEIINLFINCKMI